MFGTKLSVAHASDNEPTPWFEISMELENNSPTMDKKGG